MEDCDGQKKSSLGTELHKLDALKSQSDLIEDGPPTRYQMKTTTVSYDKSEPYRKMTYGERDTQKKHKTILLVGETGTGKTKLINGMINYMLGVKREDNVWFEITDDQSKLCSAYRQTTIITVYGFYLQESQTDLTIIDTPGYGDTRQGESDKEIAMSLLGLLKSAKEISEIHTVCLVTKSSQTRLSDRQLFILDAVQSLFGKDLAENIVLLITHSRGAIPTNVLTAVNETQIKCAVNEQNQPVYFMFDNWQSDATDKQSEKMQEHLWKLSSEGMAGFFKFLKSIKAKTLKMTQDVLHQRELLEAEISNIQTHIRAEDEKQNRQRKAKDLEQKKEWAKTKKTSEAEDEPLKIKIVDTEIVYAAVSCTVCNETCSEHCWWVTPLSWCEVMRYGHCTVCTNKCDYKEHVKGKNIYKSKKKRVKGKREDSNEDCDDKIVCSSSVNNTQDEQQDPKKVKLVMDTFHCVEKLQLISLNTDSLIILLHIDFLIEMLKEINEHEKAETLEKIKKRAGEKKQRALEYMKICVTSENLQV